tara:strand:- start:418 stop:603 length:186 start_codon:yes stop_codon:yes gene_type:complete
MNTQSAQYGIWNADDEKPADKVNNEITRMARPIGLVDCSAFSSELVLAKAVIEDLIRSETK